MSEYTFTNASGDPLSDRPATDPSQAAPLIDWQNWGPTYTALPGAADPFYSPDDMWKIVGNSVFEKDDNGDWARANTGDAEASRYITQGLLDPRMYEALGNYQTTSGSIDDLLATVYKADPFEAARLLGDINDRGSHPTNSGSDLKNFAPELYWTSRLDMATHPGNDAAWNDTIAAVDALGLDKAAGTKAMDKVMANYQRQKASEEDDGGFLGMGDLGNVLALGALAFGIPYGIEALGGGLAASDPLGAMLVQNAGTWGLDVSGLTGAVAGAGVGASALNAFDPAFVDPATLLAEEGYGSISEMLANNPKMLEGIDSVSQLGYNPMAPVVDANISNLAYGPLPDGGNLMQAATNPYTEIAKGVAESPLDSLKKLGGDAWDKLKAANKFMQPLTTPLNITRTVNGMVNDNELYDKQVAAMDAQLEAYRNGPSGFSPNQAFGLNNFNALSGRI